jgi:hypothetical protein
MKTVAAFFSPNEGPITNSSGDEICIEGSLVSQKQKVSQLQQQRVAT